MLLNSLTVNNIVIILYISNIMNFHLEITGSGSPKAGLSTLMHELQQHLEPYETAEFSL